MQFRAQGRTFYLFIYFFTLECLNFPEDDVVKWTFLWHAKVLTHECVQSTDDRQLLRAQPAECHTRKSNISNPLLPISKNSDDNSNEKGEGEGGGPSPARGPTLQCPLQAGPAPALTHRRDLGHLSAVERSWTGCWCSEAITGRS